jgi:hypothetical protein
MEQLLSLVSRMRGTDKIGTIIYSLLFDQYLLALPNSLINEIEKMFNTFWWGDCNGNIRGMHWLSWKRLTAAKGFGGMSFKSLKAFNMAMLGKQTWKILT